MKRGVPLSETGSKRQRTSFEELIALFDEVKTDKNKVTDILLYIHRNKDSFQKMKEDDFKELLKRATLLCRGGDTIMTPYPHLLKEILQNASEKHLTSLPYNYFFNVLEVGVLASMIFCQNMPRIFLRDMFSKMSEEEIVNIIDITQRNNSLSELGEYLFSVPEVISKIVSFIGKKPTLPNNGFPPLLAFAFNCPNFPAAHFFRCVLQHDNLCKLINGALNNKSLESLVIRTIFLKALLKLNIPEDVTMAIEIFKKLDIIRNEDVDFAQANAILLSEEGTDADISKHPEFSIAALMYSYSSTGNQDLKHYLIERFAQEGIDLQQRISKFNLNPLDILCLSMAPEAEIKAAAKKHKLSPSINKSSIFSALINLPHVTADYLRLYVQLGFKIENVFGHLIAEAIKAQRLDLIKILQQVSNKETQARKEKLTKLIDELSQLKDAELNVQEDKLKEMLELVESIKKLKFDFNLSFELDRMLISSSLICSLLLYQPCLDKQDFNGDSARKKIQDKTGRNYPVIRLALQRLVEDNEKFLWSSCGLAQLVPELPPEIYGKILSFAFTYSDEYRLSQGKNVGDKWLSRTAAKMT
jgi:hypothetical protein